jgi:hypothetical protein
MGTIKSGISPFEGLDHASPEPSLGQGRPTPEDLRLACNTPGVTQDVHPRVTPFTHYHMKTELGKV